MKKIKIATKEAAKTQVFQFILEEYGPIATGTITNITIDKKELDPFKFPKDANPTKIVLTLEMDTTQNILQTSNTLRLIRDNATL